MKTHGATPPPPPNDNTPVNDNVPNEDIGQCQNQYEPHTRDGGFSPEPLPNKPPPPLEMTMHLPMESCKCDLPNKTQKWGHTMQGPGTPDEPHTCFDFHLSLRPALTPKSKTCDPAKDSCENGSPRTPKMTPSWYKTVPHTHFSGIQIKAPKMMTHPNGNLHPMVKCQATPLTTPAQAVWCYYPVFFFLSFYGQYHTHLNGTTPQWVWCGDF
ncbi:hypothetical protein BS47DRAFT_1360272 [Hydnum rufescens UP504]|uniref:Uncharacterized protein n=1 Tax=Hydnum rufescens UP504 TaxID=1448309 RepID=A0A9P6B4Z8_9AGAM|nr:hypothetical protein BS47DRAFT_1360272 [Hydnum rufescens UP504]